jgi:hypothetical protein
MAGLAEAKFLKEGGLHQLRHSAATHLGEAPPRRHCDHEQDRHKVLRTVQRSVRPRLGASPMWVASLEILWGEGTYLSQDRPAGLPPIEGHAPREA